MATFTAACLSRNRSCNWSERDKILAAQLILDRDEELYGKVKGPGEKTTSKRQLWDQVQTQFNA